jgi:hypothetical protein
MTARISHRQRTARAAAAAAFAAIGVLVLTGCGAGPTTPAEASTAATPAAANAAAAAPTPTDAGLPDPCTLLSNPDVTALTGRAVTQVDRDGLAATAASRHCQWQLDSGDLAVFLSTTTTAEFAVRDPAAVDVSGVGDEAYTSSGHLLVRSGRFQLDVYATGASDDAGNQAVARATAQKLLPKL